MLVQNQLLIQRRKLIKICNIHYLKLQRYKQKENSLRATFYFLFKSRKKNLVLYAGMMCDLRIVLDFKLLR